MAAVKCWAMQGTMPELQIGQGGHSGHQRCVESKERKNWWKQVSQAHGVATKGTKGTRECMHGDNKMLGVVARDRWIKKVMHINYNIYAYIVKHNYMLGGMLFTVCKAQLHVSSTNVGHLQVVQWKLINLLHKRV